MAEVQVRYCRVGIIRLRDNNAHGFKITSDGLELITMRGCWKSAATSYKSPDMSVCLVLQVHATVV